MTDLMVVVMYFGPFKQKLAASVTIDVKGKIHVSVRNGSTQ